MNIIDVVILIVLIWSGFRGFMKGLVVSAATLVALLIGVYGAARFSWFTASVLNSRFGMESEYLPIIALGITFGLIVMGIFLLARLIDRIITAAALGFLNRSLGLFFNVIKMGFIISVILLIINEIDKHISFIPESTIENSLLYEPVCGLAPKLIPHLRLSEIKQYLEDKEAMENEGEEEEELEEQIKTRKELRQERRQNRRAERQLRKAGREAEEDSGVVQDMPVYDEE